VQQHREHQERDPNGQVPCGAVADGKTKREYPTDEVVSRQ